MRAVSAGRARAPTDIDGHDAAGSVVGSGCCGSWPDSHGSRRTRTELVKSQFYNSEPAAHPAAALLGALWLICTSAQARARRPRRGSDPTVNAHPGLGVRNV